MNNQQRMEWMSRTVQTVMLLILFTSSPFLFFTSSAQSAFDIIELNRSFAASNYSIYPDTLLPNLTPAPEDALQCRQPE